MITFTYTGAMAQPTKGTATFKVHVDGGAGPVTAADTPFGDAVVEADGQTLSVEVLDARDGAGMASVDEGSRVVTVDSKENDFVLIYTATAQIDYSSRDFRVKVPTGWPDAINDAADPAKQGTYTVTFLRDDLEYSGFIEKVAPINGQMVARLTFGAESIKKGDQIVFTYQNVTAPSAPTVAAFKMTFGGGQVQGDLNVLVGSGKDAVALAADVSADMILVEDDESVTVTVTLKDEDGNDVLATAEDLDVGLVSSNADTGSFMVDGKAVKMVTIDAGENSATASYSDSASGTTATITASSGDLSDTADIEITTDLVELTSATVTPTLAKAGDTVTVSATGTAGKTPMYSVLNADGIGVQPSAMTEDEAGLLQRHVRCRC